MRRIFSLFFCCISLAAFGQQQQYLGAPTTTVINRGHFRTDSTFQNAIRDTTFTPSRLGIQVFREADRSLYMSISTTTRPYWAKVGTGAGGGTIDTVYLYSIIEQFTRDSVFTYHDSLIIQRDSVFIYNTTRSPPMQ